MTEHTDGTTGAQNEQDIEALVEQKVQAEVERRLQNNERGRSRRSVLASLAGIAGAGALGVYGGQRAAADPSQASGTVYFEQIGDADNPVQDLYVQNQTNYSETENITAEDIVVDFVGSDSGDHGLEVIDRSTDNSEQISIKADPAGSAELVFQDTDESNYKWGYRVNSSGQFFLENHANLTSRLLFNQQGETAVLNSDLNVRDGALITERLHSTRQSPVIIGSVGVQADFDGADADARLDNALSAASSGDTVYLESTTYSDDRTLSHSGDFIGTSVDSNGTVINAAWTVSGNQSKIKSLRFEGSNANSITGDRCWLIGVYDLSDGWTISGDDVQVQQCWGIDVTYASGTSGGVADGNASATISDSGNNTIGDNS